jgi:hypothetical protein
MASVAEMRNKNKVVNFPNSCECFFAWPDLSTLFGPGVCRRPKEGQSQWISALRAGAHSSGFSPQLFTDLRSVLF